VSRAAVAIAAVVVCHALAWAGPPVSLVRVDRLASDDLVRLSAAGVPVIAETRRALLVEGTAAELGRVAALGYAFEVLDDDPASADYLAVPLTPERTLADVATHGTVVHVEDNLAYVRIARGADLPPGFEPGCFAVDRLGRDPLAPPSFVPSERSPGIDAAEPDPIVQKIVGAVDDASIQALWEDVTSNPPSGTRFSTSVGCQDAATYCHDHYVALGLAADYDDWSVTHAPNVVAEIPGAIDPDGIYILVGHLDDLPSTGVAPGADDNGSGTVTVLEAARTMACWSFRHTVRFLNVTGEEQGLLGSEAYADAARLRGDDIRGVLNFDMNGWEGDGTPVPENIDVSYNSFSQWLGELYAQNATTYATGLAVDAFSCPSLTASDHASFWANGYPAIIGITDNHNYCGHAGTYPDYHQASDTIAANGDPTLFRASIRTAVATLAELAGPFVVAFDRATYACDGVAEVIVADAGANLDPGLAETVAVTVTSDTEPAGETVVLTERGPDSRLFSGTVAFTTASPVSGDGLLSVREGDAVSTSYVDPLDCAGETDAAYAAAATIDCTAPAISGVGETDVTGTSATIVWQTAEPADATLVWGETVPPDRVETGPAGVTSHAVPLTGLQECTVYRYEVRSADEAGNLAVADDGGQYFHFETLGDFGSGLQPCHAGQVSLSDTAFSCTGTVAFEVVDLDLNGDPQAVDTAEVRLTSTTEATEEVVVVTETGPNTSRFSGTIATATGAPAADGVLQTAHDDVLTVTYADADDGTGAAAVAWASAAIDCRGPTISNLRVETITDARATVKFATDEPGDTVVEWGPTAALGEVVSSPAAVTAHATLLNRLDACGEVHVRVRSTDRFGHESVADDLGAPHRFSAGTIPGLYWKDDFEAATTTWTLGGEWETGPPGGLGGSSGPPDPAAAYNRDRVLGHDLTGRGAFGGDYEPNVLEVAATPSLDARSWSNTKLLFQRKLSVGAADDASLWAFSPQGIPLFRSSGTTVSDAAWQTASYDLSSLFDGRPSVRLEFRQQANATGQYSGWNVDDVVLKDGSLPDFAACGGCGAAPSFSGAASAADDDACADGGVTVSWNGAVSWGSGGAGTYAVYRDAAPGFVPSAANRIAAGVAGTSYSDLSLAPGATGHYLVRAENDESCSTGPANGGVTDANAVYVGATNAVSQPPPGAVAGLAVERLGAAHVRLAWAAAPAAAGYRVYRSTSPDRATFAPIADAPGTTHDDLGAGADHEAYFYLVTAVNPCGSEGP